MEVDTGDAVEQLSNDKLSCFFSCAHDVPSRGQTPAPRQVSSASIPRVRLFHFSWALKYLLVALLLCHPSQHECRWSIGFLSLAYLPLYMELCVALSLVARVCPLVHKRKAATIKKCVGTHYPLDISPTRSVSQAGMRHL